MEYLKIAQFYNNFTSSKQKKSEILKKVNIDYCIPDAIPDKRWSGYTSLHFAVKRYDLDLINELVDQGADLLKQGTTDGCTPLHTAVNATSFTRRSLYEMSGLLQEYPMVNTLLSKQVELGNILNPKNKNGVSHLHIASMVNHAKAVEFLATDKRSLDQTTNQDMNWLPGYTPLHCAIKYSSIRAVEILLQRGADVHARNTKGMSCVHLLLERVLDLSDFITMGKRTLSMPYVDEIERIETIIKLILQSRAKSKMFVDDIGLSALHVVCTLKDKSIVEDFLNQGAEVNLPVKSESTFWPGWTPLHFAACCNIEMVILLIQRGADILVKNSAGETALDLCAKRFTPADIHMILSMKSEFKDIFLSDNCTKLVDLLLVMNDCNKLNDFLRKPENINLIVPFNSPIWPGNNLLHLSMSLNEKTRYLKDFKKKFDLPETRKTRIELYNCTEEEETLYWKRIELCLEHGCSVSMKNAKEMTPIHLAFKMLKEKTVEKLLSCCEENSIDRHGLSHLHIACALGQLEPVKIFLNKGANINSQVKQSFVWYERWYDTQISINVRVDSTPLHVAVVFGYGNLVDYLLENNANVYAKDSLDLTPIHLLISTRNRPRQLAQSLFQKTPDLRDCVSKSGLSHMHIAAFANNPEAVEQMLDRGAKVDNVVECQANTRQLPFLARVAGKTPLGVALTENSDRAVKALLKGGANVYAKDPQGISALQYSMHRLSDMSAKHLIRMLKNGKCDAESSGMTLLHIACGNFDIKWVKKLLKKGFDVNAKIRAGSTLRGATPLYVLVNEANLMETNPHGFISIIKLLLNNGADVTIECCGRTPLHLIYENVYADFYLEASDDEDIDDLQFLLHAADLMLKSQNSYDINPVNSQGFSHFHFACVRNDVETVKKFLDHGVDVNQLTDPFADVGDGFTPLHFALAHASNEVAYLLLHRGAEINAEDANGNKPLHVAIKRKFVNLQLIESMLSRGADIHAKNLSEETLLYCLLKSGGLTLEGLEFFLNRGCSINILDTEDQLHQGIIGLTMLNAAPTEMQAILKRLVSVFEVTSAIQNGFNAIQSVVALDQSGELTVDDYLYAIELLMDIGCDLDQQDEEGRTALHEAVSFYNLEAIDALLQLGADVNVVDDENECAFLDTIIMTAHHFNDSREIDVVKTLARHIRKMRLTELDVNDSNLRSLEKAERQIPSVNSLEQSYQDELIKAKETEICHSLTVKDFLLEMGAVAEYPRMCPIRRAIVDKFFKCSANLRQDFPEFCGLLAFQYRKISARMELWQPAKEAVAFICKIELPDLCLEALVRYFTNSEMKFIIELAQELLYDF